MQTFNLNLLGIDASFKADADPELVDQSMQILETASERLKSGGGLYSRDKLLVLVALGVAYDLLQTRHELEETRKRISGMLQSIEDLA